MTATDPPALQFARVRAGRHLHSPRGFAVPASPSRTRAARATSPRPSRTARCIPIHTRRAMTRRAAPEQVRNIERHSPRVARRERARPVRGPADPDPHGRELRSVRTRGIAFEYPSNRRSGCVPSSRMSGTAPRASPRGSVHRALARFRASLRRDLAHARRPARLGCGEQARSPGYKSCSPAKPRRPGHPRARAAHRARRRSASRSRSP